MKIRKKTKNLMIISICLLILLSSGGINTIYVTRAIAGAPKLINDFGIVRGSIQRVSKLELNLQKDDEFIQHTDNHINGLYENVSNTYHDDNELVQHITDIKTSWGGLKECIYIYRENPSRENQERLMEHSERLWIKTNNAVLVSQIITEEKMKSYKISFWLFLINTLLVIIIIVFIKGYVQGTLEHMMRHDGLTGIFNRRYFDECLTNEVMKGRRYEGEFSLIIFDIDHFKKVNDRHGHDIGDYVLKELVNKVKSNIRETDTLARIGGEEFAIITPETDIQGAQGLSEKIRKIIENYIFKEVGKITISLGITQFHQEDNADDIYKRADIALYKAKENGRNRSEIETKKTKELPQA